MLNPRDIVIQLGLMFIAAVVFGRAARLIKVPKVAGYLIGGLIIGPHVLGWLDAGIIKNLEPLTGFALALIMFDIGTNFELKRLRRQRRFLLPLAAVDIGITLILVFLGIIITGKGFTLALLLGILAVATAPAATLLVLKEFQAEGDITDSLIGLVGINNTFSIIAFEIALALILTLQGSEPLSSVFTAGLLGLAAALALGAAAGLITSYLEQKVVGTERVILFLGLVIGVFGICLHFQLSYMLVFLIMGAVVTNTSEFTREILKELDKIGWPLYVLFFLVAGARLHIEGLKTLGLVSIVYLAARTLGKVGGVKFFTRIIKKAPYSAREIGWGLLTQAGCAVGLAMVAVQKIPQIGVEIETIIVSTVIFFEIAGSILVRLVVVRAGEVKAIALIDRPLSSPYALSMRALGKKLLTRLGVGHWESPGHIEKLRIHHVMSKNVRTIPANASFSEIMSFISHCRFNNFPVTGADNHYEGMISYPELREVIYDPSLSHIMIALDFVRGKDIQISPESSLFDALEKFNHYNTDCLPVVDHKTGRLLGLLEQREVIRLCGKNRTGESV